MPARMECVITRAVANAVVKPTIARACRILDARYGVLNSYAPIAARLSALQIDGRIERVAGGLFQRLQHA